jgi:NAD(P)-dependent dehydrogenase (short-subunit alcohol dehydrogenase family)
VTGAKRFSGRVALITGGSSGLGRATALRLASEGAALALADLDGAGAEETRRRAGDLGAKVLCLHADVTRAADCEAMVADTLRELGRLDVLFPAAGVGAGGTVEDTTEEQWDRVVDLGSSCRASTPCLRCGREGAARS